MKLFKKRSFAVLILVVVIILSSVLGINRSLASLAGDIEDMFYEGVDGETPINTYLENCINAVKMITIIADGYPELKPLRDELYDAYNDLYAANTISAKFAANREMQRAFSALYNVLIELDTLSNNNYEDALSYADTVYNTQDKILRSSYNSEVDRYEDILSSFPLSLLEPLIFVDAPERFA